AIDGDATPPPSFSQTSDFAMFTMRLLQISENKGFVSLDLILKRLAEEIALYFGTPSIAEAIHS
ncbi:MAG: hypothetical protein WAK33_20085, partial [Silvibacterium sp.]